MKTFKIVLWVVLLVLIIYFVNQKLNKIEYNADDNKVVQSTKSELEKIMEEESFKKATILRARKVANDKKKEIEIQRNKETMKAIENEYELIRSGELELVGNDVSLK